MSKVSMSVESKVPVDDVEEMFENLKPIISMIISDPVIHITVEEED